MDFRSPNPDLDGLSKEELQQWFLNYEDRHHDPSFDQLENINVHGLGYSYNEGYRMLKFIHAFDLHDFVGGSAIWKKMADMRIVLGTRKWQSVQSHFLNIVMKYLLYYRATEEDRWKFQMYYFEISNGRKHRATSELKICLEKIFAVRSQNAALAAFNELKINN